MRYSLQGVCHDAVGVYFFPCKVCVMKLEEFEIFPARFVL